MTDNNLNLPPYINMSTMAKLLQLSRSRLYQLIDQGALLKPVYLLNNKRPVYTREMAVRNLEVKNSNVGINSEVIMFYSARVPTATAKPKKTVNKAKDNKTKNGRYVDLIDALESLGLEGVISSEIDAALQVCFPEETPDMSDDETLITIFRYLKRRNCEHKPRT